MKTLKTKTLVLSYWYSSILFAFPSQNKWNQRKGWIRTSHPLGGFKYTFYFALLIFSKRIFDVMMHIVFVEERY